MITSKKTSDQSIKKRGRKPKVITEVKSKSIKEMFHGIALRPRKPKTYCAEDEKVENDEEFEPQQAVEDDDDDYLDEPKKKKKVKRGIGTALTPTSSKKAIIDFEDIYEDDTNAKAEDIEEALNKIPKNRKQLEKLAEKVEERLAFFKQQFIQEQFDMEKKKSSISENAIPVCADVTSFDWKKLSDVQSKVGGRLFDVIMMDPPWQLSSSQPSRGVAIAYSSLSDEFIQKIPIPKLQTNGFIFIWTINAKYAITVKLMEHWGYKLVDEITWIKKTVNGKIAKGHGFYLQHAKESCLIGVKGKIDSSFQKNIGSDIIFSQRRGQSQKPEEIYELIEKLIPNGFYLEIFGRRNNLRDRWVTVGNEL